MFNTINRPHPFSLAAMPRTPPSIRTSSTASLPIYEPIPNDTSFLQLSPSSYNSSRSSSLRSRASLNPPEYMREDEPMTTRHPFAFATPIVEAEEEPSLFGCPITYATRRLPELEERVDSSDYTPRRLSYPILGVDGAVSRRVQVRLSEDHTLGNAQSRVQTASVATQTPSPAPIPGLAFTRSGQTPAASDVIASQAESSIERMTTMSQSQGPVLHSVKWVNHNASTKTTESWSLHRYQNGDSVHKEVTLNSTRDSPGSARTRVEITPPLDNVSPKPFREIPTTGNPSTSSARSPFLTLDKALTNLYTHNNALDTANMELEMVRIEILVAVSASYTTANSLKEKKRELKDRVKVLERQVDIALGVIEFLTDIDHTAKSA